MARGYDIKLNSRGMAALLKDDGLRPPLRREADRIAGRAKSGAPVESGEYRDKIGVESGTTDRVVERVVARAAHSLVVEARTGNLKRATGG